jgi:hypothetical protein
VTCEPKSRALCAAVVARGFMTDSGSATAVAVPTSISV